MILYDIISYSKQLLIRRNSRNSEGYRNSNNVCTMGPESLRCLLHYCSSGQWWPKANEICALLWFKRETEYLFPRQQTAFILIKSVYVFKLNFKIYLWLTQVQWLKLIRSDNYDFVTQGFTISLKKFRPYRIITYS